MAGPGTLHSRGLGIAVDHDPRLPASHQHQLILVATFSQPASREGMPKLMRMYRRQPSGPGPVMDHLIHAGRGHGPVAPDPKVWQVVQPVLVAYPQVAVEGLGGLAADRQGPGSATLAEHPHDPLVQVNVAESYAGALGPTHPSVDQEKDDGGIAAAGEVTTLAGLQQPSQVLWPNHFNRLLRQLRRAHAAHGADLESPSATAHLKKAFRLR